MLKFSVVIPVFNEEWSIAGLYLSLVKSMEELGQPYEVIFVDDCSTDESLEVLKNLDSKSANLTIISLNKNSGQALAMQAGFDLAQAELIITLDGDLQNDPKDIVKLLDKFGQGYDVVCGWRKERKDHIIKLFVSKVGCWLLRIIIKSDIHDFGCTLRIFRRAALEKVYLSGGMHRLFIVIMSKLGYKIGEIEVCHRPRSFGSSKYNIHNRVFEFLADLLRFIFLGVPKLSERGPRYQVREIIRR